MGALVVDGICNVWRYLFLFQRADWNECTAVCGRQIVLWQGGDEVDVGGGQRAGVPVSKRKDGKVLRSQSRANYRFVIQREEQI